jgi:polar amino acid transport system substrate-binding protein
MDKKKKIISIFLILSMVIMAVALSGCQEEVVENKIIIGTDAAFPPFEYVVNGTIVGFDIEMATMILENLNYTVEVQDILFDTLITALNAGNIDVIAAAMTITPEREEQIDFSIPYFEANQSILIMTDSDLNITSTDNLTGLTIGAQSGTTGQFWVEDNLGDNATLELYDLYIQAVLDLEAGRVDVVIVDIPVGQVFAEDADKEIVLEIETNELYGIGVRKGDSELLDQINQELEELMNSDEWIILQQKYFKEQ